MDTLYACKRLCNKTGVIPQKDLVTKKAKEVSDNLSETGRLEKMVGGLDKLNPYML